MALHQRLRQRRILSGIPLSAEIAWEPQNQSPPQIVPPPAPHVETEWERRQRERKSWVPPRVPLPIQHDSSKLLPVFTDESLRATQIKATTSRDTYTVNLLDYTCTSPHCMEIHSEVPPRDFGRLCKHMILALRQKNLVAQLPPIARGIADNGRPEAYGVYPGHFATDLNGNPAYITGQNYDGWIGVFALKRRDGVNFYRFGYNVRGKRWTSFNDRGLVNLRPPKIDEAFLY
jgi:hypothetical protein